MSKPITIIYSNGSAHPKTSLGWADHAKLIAILHVAKVVIVMSHSLLHICTRNYAHVGLLHMHVVDISMLGMGFNGLVLLSRVVGRLDFFWSRAGDWNCRETEIVHVLRQRPF